jgi:hypothetical protein
MTVRLSESRWLGFLATILILAGAIAPALPAKEKWDPIPAEDLAATECKSYPGAHAEVLFIHLVLNGGSGDDRSEYYKRIKIYSAKGAEELGVLGIDRAPGQRVSGQAARVIKPDGSTKEYGKADFNETVKARLKGTKVNQLVLAVPDLAAGDIVELRWTSSIESDSGNYYWWYAQLEIPVREYTLETESLARDYVTIWFNVHGERGDKGSKQRLALTMRNLAPYEEEHWMPPERDTRGWFMIMFRDIALRQYPGNDFMEAISTYQYGEFRRETKPDAPIKAKATALLQGATTDDEKLRRLYNFCQQNVKNFDYIDSAELQAAKKKLGSDMLQSPRNTLARGSGGTNHVNELFASFARAAGYEVALGLAASRYSTLNVRNDNGWLFLRDRVILVKVAGAWRMFAPGDYLVPAGLLDRSNLNVSVLLCADGKVIWESSPVPAATESEVFRRGRFTVDAEGTLQGEVEISMTGYPAIKRKRDARGEQQDVVESEYRETITKLMPTAEITELGWENLRDLALPLKIRFKLVVPGYAEAVGSKLIVPLNPFTHNRPAVFAAEKRQFPIFLDYPFVERDDVEIVLPEGFKPDAPAAPRNVGEVDNIGATYRVAYQQRARTIVYKRDLIVGNKGNVAYAAAAYPALKARFAAIQASDEHALVFTTEPEAAPAAQADTP